MARNLRLGDPRTINKSDDTIHTSFVKQDIFRKIHYIHNRYIYPLPKYHTSLWMIGIIKYPPYACIGYKFRREITGRVKWSPEYEKAVDLVKLWVLLNTRYYEHHYNGQRITQLQWKFPHVTSNINKVDIITEIWYAYLVSKVTKNQAEDLSIEFCTNIYDAIKEAVQVPASMHIPYMQQREEDCTLDIQIKYIAGKYRKSSTTFITKQYTDSSTL